MPMTPPRWNVIAESQFPWEREALEWLRARLPDREPWRAWTNFEFIDDEGKVSEVDALVLSPDGLFLVEIKSRPGVLTGDVHSWTWTTDGRSATVDNPVILANRKAKRLASLLKRQPAITKAKMRLPFVKPAIFLSSTSLSCRLEGLAKSATFQRGRPGALDDPGIVGALANGITNRSLTTVDSQQARAIARGHMAMYLGLPNYANNLRRLGFGDDDLANGGSDRLVDAIVAWGDVDAIRARVRAHHDAGADHVCIQVLPPDPRALPMEAWRELAPALLGT